MAKIEEYNNGCGRIIINDINYEEIALDRYQQGKQDSNCWMMKQRKSHLALTWTPLKLMP